MFLSQEIKNTPVEGTLDLDLLNKMHFNDFTYSGEKTDLQKIQEQDINTYDIKVASESIRESNIEIMKSPTTASKQIEETTA